MTRHTHLPLFAALSCANVAALPACAASRHLTANGPGLEIDSPCARQVTITPDQPAGAGVTLDATADHQEEADQLVLTSGSSVKLTVPEHFPNSCWRPVLDFNFEPTLELTLHVAPGTPISIDEGGRPNYDIGNVGGPLSLDLSGAVHVKAGSVGAVKLSLSGAGGVAIARANGPLQAEISGYGSLDIADATLSTASLELSGAGSVHLVNGTIGELHLESSGTADVTVGGTVGDASVEISGVGSVNIAKVTGALSKDVSGVGSVTIGAR